MENKKNHIGLVLDNNLQDADSTVRAFERIAMKIDQVADLYEAIGIGKFSKEALEDIMANRTKNVQKQLLDAVEKEMNKAGIKIAAVIESQKKSALEQLKPLADAVNSLLAVLDKESAKQTASIELLSVVNNAGRLKIDKAFKLQVIEQYTIKIRTEAQSDFYQLFLDAKEKVELFVSKAQEYGVPFHAVADEYNLHALMQVDRDDYTLSLNPMMIEHIN